jgi:hypothetical protein
MRTNTNKNHDPNTIMLNYEFCNIQELKCMLLKGTDLVFEKIKLYDEAPATKTPFMEEDLFGNDFHLFLHSRYRGGIGIEINFDATLNRLRKINQDLICQGIRCKWRVEYMNLRNQSSGVVYNFRTEMEGKVCCMYLENVNGKHYTSLSKEEFKECIVDLADITYTPCYKKNGKREPAEKCSARFQTDEQLKDMDSSIRNVWN